MYHVRKENLPFVGSSHEFVGAEQGDTGVSVFLFHGKPGFRAGSASSSSTLILVSAPTTC